MRLLRLQCLHPKTDQFQHLHSLALQWRSLIAPRVRANGGDRVRTTSVQAWRRLVTGRSMSDRMNRGGTMAGHGSNYVWFTLRWLYTEGTQVKLCPTRRLLIHHRDEGIWEGGICSTEGEWGLWYITQGTRGMCKSLTRASIAQWGDRSMQCMAGMPRPQDPQHVTTHQTHQ